LKYLFVDGALLFQHICTYIKALITGIRGEVSAVKCVVLRLLAELGLREPNNRFSIILIANKATSVKGCALFGQGQHVVKAFAFVIFHAYSRGDIYAVR
jgi:hypothetical protein